MERFTQANTVGYTDEELVKLNHLFNDRVKRYSQDDKSFHDYVAERVLAEFDGGLL
jgi:hypothetical protein